MPSEKGATRSHGSLLVTSIPPRVAKDAVRLALVRSALASFEENGYATLSLRRKGEPATMLDIDTLQHAEGTDRGFFRQRYGPSFSDIFRLAGERPIAAIVNSDVYMVPSRIEQELRSRRGTVVCSRRIDVDSLGGGFEGVYGRGIDGLFFSPDIDLGSFEQESFAEFQLGAPFWDIVIPIVLSFHFDLLFQTPPVLLHAVHEQNWRQDDYANLRRKAIDVTVNYARKLESRSPRAAQFVNGLSLYSKATGASGSTDREVKRVATYMVTFLERLEEQSAIAADMDLNDPYMRACVYSMTSTDRDHVNAARLMSRVYRSGYSPLTIAAMMVKTLLRVRRTAKRRQSLAGTMDAAVPVPLGKLSPRSVRRPLVRVRLGHDLWNPDQYEPREILLDESYRNAVDHASANARIALVTPSFNHLRFLPQTVKSVLSQAYPRISYHVQDGGSSDGTSDYLRSLGDRISYDSRPDTGQSHAINLGFASVSGDIMAYLNSDDILLPGSLAYVDRFFCENADVDIIYSHRIFIDEAGRETGRAILPRHDADALRWADYIPQETLFWRRKVWETIGPFDETLDFAMDWDFILKALDAGFSFARVPRFLGAFRIHATQKTSTSIDDGGAREMTLLRQRHLGFRPTAREIDDAIRPYLNRQAMVRLLDRYGLLRF